MKRKQLLWMIPIFLCAWLACGYWKNSRKLQVDNFQFIQKEMTLEQVEYLLGGSPGSYGNSDGTGFTTLNGVVLPDVYLVKRVWHDKTNHFEVYFDINDKVVTAHRRIRYGENDDASFSRFWRKTRLALGI